jgi:hypothetical protein
VKWFTTVSRRLRYPSEEKEIKALADWPFALPADGTQLADVGILLRTGAQIDHLARKLTDAGIESIRLRPNMVDDRRLPGVRLSTMHRAKGLDARISW